MSERILGVLQEFATAVGNLNAVNTLGAMGAGMKTQLLIEIHDLNELKGLMGEGWMTWLGYAAFHLYFAPSVGDLTTSDHIAAMTGRVDVLSVKKSGIGKAAGQFQFPNGALGAINQVLAGRGPEASIDVATEARNYLLSQEIRDLPGDEMLVFAERVPGVIRAGRRSYLTDPEFQRKFEENPYHSK